METQSAGPSLHVARTKFNVPLLPADVLVRPRLLFALQEALKSRRLILLSAPAGYGKTTLLAALPQASADLPMAWLSLDEDDNDPGRFLAALIIALRSLAPACGANAQALLTEFSPSTVRRDPAESERRIVSVLINDILSTLPDPFTLLLDDLHRVTEAAVYVALDHLLDRLPPQMHVVMSSRHDPPLALARLRARGQMAELRMGDLRFTVDESAEWLDERLRLRLTTEELATLESLTEGWVAGLRLLALSLEQLSSSSARTEFLAQVARRDRSVFDFLAEEVLDHQPPKVKEFLLELSFIASVGRSGCRAISGRRGRPWSGCLPLWMSSIFPS